MIDRKWIGHDFGSSELTIERGRLRFFAKATGETNPLYSDVDAARAAGYADLPVPPTCLFAVELDSGAMFGRLDTMQVPHAKVLHAEQGFEYFAPIVAGDTVTAHSRVHDIHDKKNGALEFIGIHTRVTNQRGEHVANLRSLTVVRNA